MKRALITGVTGKQWAYLAGIFDGEGSVHLSRARNKSGSLKTYQLCVTVVCGTNREAIEAIKEMLGQHGRKLAPINGTGNKRRAWRLRIWGGHASAFLMGVRPYLLMKGAQADLGIAHQAAKPVSGSRCDAPRATREEASKLALTALNHRGVQ